MSELPWDLKGLWIPKEIMFADDLLWTERLLLTLIFHLDNDKGCWAGNKLFANVLETSERQVGRYLAKLKSRGFITVTVKNRYERTIRMSGKFAHVPDAKLKKLAAMREDLAAQMSVNQSRHRGRGVV